MAQRQSARTELELRYTKLAIGAPTEQDYTAIQDCAQRLLGKELELRTKAADRVRVLEQYVEFQRFVELRAQNSFQAGAIRMQEFERCRFLRLEAELQLLKAKRAKK